MEAFGDGLHSLVLIGNGDGPVGQDPPGQAGSEFVNEAQGGKIFAKCHGEPFTGTLHADGEGPPEAYEGHRARPNDSKGNGWKPWEKAMGMWARRRALSSTACSSSWESQQLSPIFSCQMR